RKRRLGGVHKLPALGRRTSASPAVFAARERLNAGQKLLRHEGHGLTQPLAIHREGRMYVEAVASARAGRLGARKGGIAVGDVNDSRQISAHERLERGTRLGKVSRQLASKDCLRLFDRSNDPAATEESACRPR